MVILLRHASTDWNVKERGGETEFVRGNIDIGLDDQGRAEAYHAAKRICRYPVKEIRRGTYKRDIETARIVAQVCQIPEVEVPALDPWNTGDLSGKIFDLVWPVMSLLIDLPDIPAPGGESYGQHRDKFDASFWKTYDEYGGRADAAVVLVLHGTEFRALPNILYGVPVRTDQREHVKPAEMIVLN
jgi:broad specificity phosphatase PhoE